ncbi:hypothetical protein ZOSMA_167G00010, partial [Zostera marina]
ALRVFLGFRKSLSESLNEFILASVLRACVQLRDIVFARQIQSFVVRSGFEIDVYVGTSLVNFYSKVGLMDDAWSAFDHLPVKNSVTWTAVIVGYSQIGSNMIALNLFDSMLKTDVRPDKFVISSAISACSSLNFIDDGKQIHGYLYRNEIELDISLNNVVLDFYTKCRKVNVASKLFETMTDSRNIVSWTTMIAGYMQNSCDTDAMELFAEMTRSGWAADAFACTSVLASCGAIFALQQGRQVHTYVVKSNLDNDEYVMNALIDMYAKCDSLADSRAVFDGMITFTYDNNTVSYNAIIQAYASEEDAVGSVKLFNKMRSMASCHPNLVTFVSLLGVSASCGEVDLGRQIHGLVVKSGEFLDLYSGTALVDLYSKCLRIADASLVFDEMEEQDIVVWNAMISGHTLNEEHEEAVKKYRGFCVSSGMKPNEFTFVALMTASTSLASLFLGTQFHCQIIKTGTKFDSHVSNALIDMYAKCGDIEEAKEIFLIEGVRDDIVCWNSMISRCAEHGHAGDALNLFEEMLTLKKKKLKPNSITFLGILSACSHAGLVESGLSYFNSMESRFEVKPDIEHYACMADLLGRAGRLSEAQNLIEHMPFEASSMIWRSFLGWCRVFGEISLGKHAAKKAMVIQPDDSGPYVLLSNIFASKGMWGDVKKLRNRMDRSGIVKEAGCSWIEIGREVHSFTSQDMTTHPHLAKSMGLPFHFANL